MFRGLRPSSRVETEFKSRDRDKGGHFILSLCVAISLTGLVIGLSPYDSFPSEGSRVAEAVARELIAGTTEGRQALVGNIWYAPLPSLATLIFAPFFKYPIRCGAPSFASMLALVWVITLFARRLLPRKTDSSAIPPPIQECDTADALTDSRGETASKTRGPTTFPRAVASLLKALLLFPVTGFLYNCFLTVFNFDPYQTLPAAAAIAAIVKLADWIRTRRVRDWVKFTFAFSALALCGIRGFIPAAVLLVAAILALLCRRTSRERFGGLAFLFLSPFIYCLCVWSLMSFLILGDFAFPLRGLKKELFTTHCEQSCTESDLLKSVFEYVDKQTPYGRVFICGYDGLAQTLSLPPELKKKTEPCIDLHIDLVRKAYVKQNIYFLVHKPVGPSVLNSSSWRYPSLYDEGHGHLLYCADYGNWRLFELISAQPD